MLFQASHCHLLGWLRIILYVSWQLVDLCSRCPTIAHCGGSVSSQVSHCGSLRSLCVVPGVPLLLSGLALCHYRCPTLSHWSGCVWFQVSHCSLGWFHMFLAVKLLLSFVTLCHVMCPTAIHWSGFALFQVFWCHSWECLCCTPGVWLPLTKVTLGGFRCHTAVNLGGSMSF